MFDEENKNYKDICHNLINLKVTVQNLYAGAGAHSGTGVLIIGLCL